MLDVLLALALGIGVGAGIAALVCVFMLQSSLHNHLNAHALNGDPWSLCTTSRKP